jgi:hypothetical protein
VARRKNVIEMTGQKRPISMPDDGTRQLLRGGSAILAAGVAAMSALIGLLGGVGMEGAHSNLGWLALIVGMMCLPFGALLTLLGVAKWLRNRGQRRGA